MLSRIVDWYNEVKLKVVPCEFDIIKEELELINNKLLIALETAKWSDYDEVYIKDLHDDLQNLNERVLKAKENVDKIIKSLKSWGDRPMYKRHDSDPNNLMIPDEFNGFIFERQTDVLTTKQLIDEIVEENFRLFFNLPLKKPGNRKTFLDSFETLKNLDLERSSAIDRPSEVNVSDTDKAAQASASQITLRPISTSTLSFDSDDIMKTEAQLELYRAYEDHLDKLILKEIQNALRVSLMYIKMEMENRMEKVDAPLFEARLELQAPYLCFFPVMDNNLKYTKGFLTIVTSMIANILNMTDLIPIIAQPSDAQETVTFAFYLQMYNNKERKDRDFEDIENIQMDIISMTRECIKDAQDFAKEFDKYSFLWLTDKKRHLSDFLKYGRKLTADEQDEIENGLLELKEKPPELNDFKNMIEYYDQLYNEIEKIDELHNVNTFLRVNLNDLKYGLLNLVCKWSYLFKEYLRNKVIDDLRELEDFIRDSTALLEQEPTNEDYDLLLRILKTLSLINERERKTDEMFEPLKKIVDLLKTYDVTFDERIGDQFAELPEKWITLKKLGVLVKQSIASVQSYQVDLIKKRIMLFDLRTKLYHEKFMKLPVSKRLKVLDDLEWSKAQNYLEKISILSKVFP
jgi:dynein heavy chain, axonemal